MSENKFINDTEVILNIPAVNDNVSQNPYEIGKGWPHYKDLDISDGDYIFSGEIQPFTTFSETAVEFPPPLEAASYVKKDDFNASVDLDKLHAILCAFDENGTELNGTDTIDNSLYGQDGYDKSNYTEAVITGFNLDLGTDSAGIDFNFDFDMELNEGLNQKKPITVSYDMLSQINRRLRSYITQALKKTDDMVKTGYNKEVVSDIVDGIMDKLQNEIDEVEDISLEVQRTDWSRYRLLRSVIELFVVIELNVGLID